MQRRELGEEDPQTLATMHHLGHCLYRRDRREATGVLGRALELRRRVLGDDHDDTLFTARLAAVCYALEGRHEEAERLLRRTLEARRRAFGDQHRETLVTMYWLAGHLARRRPARGSRGPGDPVRGSGAPARRRRPHGRRSPPRTRWSASTSPARIPRRRSRSPSTSSRGCAAISAVNTRSP